MLLSVHTPPHPISEYVDRFWICSDKPSHARERILPSGTVELVVNLTDDEVRVYDPATPTPYKSFPGSVVSGTYSSAFAIDPSQHALMMGVHFKPGGAFRFLGSVVGELTDSHIALEELWGPAAVDLRARLCGASTDEQRFSLMQQALAARMRPAWEPHAAVPAALGILQAVGQGVSCRGVAESVGLSQRRFIELFRSQVGLTPKLFCRVLRFQRARALAGWIARPDWASVALGCGYSDQSHLIRDFRRFSGMRPTEYLRLRSEAVLLNHVPAVD